VPALDRTVEEPPAAEGDESASEAPAEDGN
jgi:hypothetical protein